MTEYNIKIIDELLFLLNEKWRYKVAYGGRGSGKSYGFADACLVRAISGKTRILCARQIQASIKDSVHKLLCDRISALKLDALFEITRDSIRCITGSEFIFKGIQNNVMEIKSMEGIDVCWVEEAQSVNDESWEVLIPTIRKEDSEIWVTFNPNREEDSTYRRFVTSPPPDCKSVLVNYMDNPYFPDVLRKEMEYCKQIDYPRYEHIWLGKTIMETEAQIFKGKFEIKEFEAEPYTEFYYGADWGFACLGGDTMVSTNKGDVPIKNIKVGDMVLTREGYKNSIIATGDHRVFTEDGWKCVSELKEKETICQNRLNLMGRFIKGIRKVNTPTIFTTKQEKRTESTTGMCGSFIMGLFRMVMIFITLMGILLIMPLEILFVLAKVNTRRFTIKTNLEDCQKKLPAEMDIQKKIGWKEEKNLWKRLKKGVVYAKNVGENLLSRMFTRSFVVQGVENTQIHVIAKKNTFVKRAVKNLWHHLIAKEKLVQKNVHINLHLLKEKQEVYDITVENGEFFANGILVHNCDPTAITRCFIKDKCLYIDYEAGGIGVEMEEIPALFDSIPDVRKWKIRSDCARPETISYVARQGFDCVGAEKWKGSVEDGIEYLRSFEKIYIHPRCKHTYDEFKYYSYKKDKISGDILPIVVDAWNHYIDSIRYALEPYIKNKGRMVVSDGWEMASEEMNNYF